MPKARVPSLIRNLRIELVVDNDDPAKFQVFVTYDILDEDGNLLSQGRQEVDIDTSKHSNAVELIEEVAAAVMAEHELTPGGIQTGKDRAEQRRQEQEAEREQRREEREAEIEAAAEALRQKYAPDMEAEIEQAAQRLRDELIILPVPDTSAPAEILEDLLQKQQAEQERLLQEQIEAGEAYEDEQAQAEQQRQLVDAELIRQQAQEEGVPVPPTERPRRPSR